MALTGMKEIFSGNPMARPYPLNGVLSEFHPYISLMPANEVQEGVKENIPDWLKQLSQVDAGDIRRVPPTINTGWFIKFCKWCQ